MVKWRGRDLCGIFGWRILRKKMFKWCKAFHKNENPIMNWWCLCSRSCAWQLIISLNLHKNSMSLGFFLQPQFYVWVNRSSEVKMLWKSSRGSWEGRIKIISYFPFQLGEFFPHPTCCIVIVSQMTDRDI